MSCHCFSNPAEQRNDRPPCQHIHSLLCITPAMDSLWDRITPQECPLFFLVPASFAFIYLAAFSVNRKDWMFRERRCHDASRNVGQKRFYSRRRDAPAHRTSTSISFAAGVWAQHIFCCCVALFVILTYRCRKLLLLKILYVWMVDRLFLFFFLFTALTNVQHLRIGIDRGC